MTSCYLVLKGFNVDFLVLLEETPQLLLIPEHSDSSITEGKCCLQVAYLSFFISHSLMSRRNRKNMVP